MKTKLITEAEVCPNCNCKTLYDIGRKMQCESATCSMESTLIYMHNDLQPPVDMWHEFTEDVLKTVNELEINCENQKATIEKYEKALNTISTGNSNCLSSNPSICCPYIAIQALQPTPFNDE